MAWDGGVHAFLLDSLVTVALRKQGYGTRIVQEAVRQVKETRCEWLHVDFEPHLREFCFEACGFRPADAGLIRLRDELQFPDRTLFGNSPD